MTHYALAPLLGSGAADDPFRGSDQPESGIIDLRPDSTVPDGWCLLATPERERRPGVFYLGDDLDAPSNAARNGLASRLGLTFRTSTPDLRRLAWELLLEHGRWDRTRWNPLRPGRDGVGRVYLGSLLREERLGPGRPASVTIHDDFNRADADPLGMSAEGWSWTEIDGDIDIVSNVAKVLNASALARAGQALDTDDHYAQGFVTVSNIGVVLRKDGTATQTYYHGRYTSGSNHHVYKVVGGSFTQLATNAAGGSNATVRLEVDGSGLTYFRDGVQAMTATDTAIVGNLYTGIRGATNNATVDDFEAGDLVVATEHSRAISDAVGLLDPPTSAASSVRIPTDALGLLDPADRAVGSSRSAAEVLGIGDQAAGVAAAGRSVVDPVALLDPAVQAVAFGRPIADLVGLSDLLEASSSAIRTAIDPLGLLDPAAQASSVFRAASDLVGFLDDAAGRVVIAAALADPMGILDAASRVSVVRREVLDPVGLVDAVSQVTAALRSAIDGLGILDQLSTRTVIAAVLVDPVGLLDPSSRTAIVLRSATDPLGMADFTARTLTAARSATDVLGLTDVVEAALIQALAAVLTDALELRDGVVFTLVAPVRPSAIDEAELGLLALLQGRLGFAGVRVELGDPGVHLLPEHVWITEEPGGDQEYVIASAANPTRQETFELQVGVFVAKSGDSPSAARLRAQALAEEIEQAIRSDPTLGGAVWDAQVERMARQVGATESSRGVRQRVRVACLIFLA